MTERRTADPTPADEPTAAELEEIRARMSAELDAAPEPEPPTGEGLAEDLGSAERGWYVESLSMREACLLVGVVKPTSPREALKALLLRRRMPVLNAMPSARPRRTGRAPAPRRSAYPFTFALAWARRGP